MSSKSRAIWIFLLALMVAAWVPVEDPDRNSYTDITPVIMAYPDPVFIPPVNPYPAPTEADQMILPVIVKPKPEHEQSKTPPKCRGEGC